MMETQIKKLNLKIKLQKGMILRSVNDAFTMQCLRNIESYKDEILNIRMNNIETLILK